MMTQQSIRDQILDAAELRARQAGYNGFSFRDLAEAVGIKSASVHYHFPAKTDLAEALVRRYIERARAQLGDGAALTRAQAESRVKALFSDALLRDDQMCLCGLFGAERDGLPPEVGAQVAGFFRLLIDFLTSAEGGLPAAAAAHVARLEGALILARGLRDPTMFEQALAGS